MFSGLTNQVSSWMGSKSDQQQQQEEETSSPQGEQNNPATTPPEKKDASPTKHSKLDMLSNVKSQIGGIGGWLGSSIPKLRKNDEGEPQEGNQPSGEETTSSPSDLKPAHQQKDDDDDNSSATGGADSGPGSMPESPTEEKEGQFGNVQSKALAGAKSFGNFLYTAVNKAGKTVSEASAKIKKTSILGEFNKEQEAFLKSQSGNNTASALPPWEGLPNEAELKEQCLSLSTDRRNFVRAPPSGVDFNFDYETMYPVAISIMEQDNELKQMRYELVPKIINEENFWRNYFYRVTLICQAKNVPRDADSQLNDQPLDTGEKVKAPESLEFVSDTLQASTQDIDEVQKEMKKLALGGKTTEEEWERELEAELQEYEMVADQKQVKAENWDRDIEELLDDDNLK